MLCQATSPLRSGKSILKAYKMFSENKCDNLVSFSESDKSLNLFSSIDENGCPSDIIGIDRGYRRQAERKHFYPNGAIYISNKSNYLEYKSFFTEKTLAYVMDKSESIDIDDKYDFTDAIGRIYFNHQIRERSNKEFYKLKYNGFNEEHLLNKLIIGDSRMEQIQLNGFSNISVGGITAHTVYENIDVIIGNREFNECFLALGVNDLITGYGVEATKEILNKLIKKLLDKNIKLIISKIIYTVYRFEVNNDDLEEINRFLEEIGTCRGIKIIDPNEIVSDSNNLKFIYTSDGLHMNNGANNILLQFYRDNLSE